MDVLEGISRDQYEHIASLVIEVHDVQNRVAKMEQFLKERGEWVCAPAPARPAWRWCCDVVLPCLTMHIPCAHVGYRVVTDQQNWAFHRLQKLYIMYAVKEEQATGVKASGKGKR